MLVAIIGSLIDHFFEKHFKVDVKKGYITQGVKIYLNKIAKTTDAFLKKCKKNANFSENFGKVDFQTCPKAFFHPIGGQTKYLKGPPFEVFLENLGHILQGGISDQLSDQ